MPAQWDTIGHTLLGTSGAVYHCQTPRGLGMCACRTFRLCDPGHHRCAEDCGCACHGGMDSFVLGVLDGA
jgi:hypothetical protein